MELGSGPTAPGAQSLSNLRLRPFLYPAPRLATPPRQRCRSAAPAVLSWGAGVGGSGAAQTHSSNGCLGP
eukprot:4542968-Alexandrium_andersonii.AAC.1